MTLLGVHLKLLRYEQALKGRGRGKKLTSDEVAGLQRRFHAFEFPQDEQEEVAQYHWNIKLSLNLTHLKTF